MSAPLVGQEAARALAARLRDCKTSPTVLFWLKLRRATLSQTELGTLLLKLCDDLSITTAYLGPIFFQAVTELSRNLHPICPDFYSVDGKKAEAIEKFKKQLCQRRALEGCGDPYHLMGALMPFCFQCLCPKSDMTTHAFAGALFFIFATPEDGLRMILKIYQNKGAYDYNGDVRVFTQVYEHRIGANFLGGDVKGAENRLAYIMLDWEIEESKLQNRLTGEQIKKLCADFPLWFYKQMHDKLLVDHDAFVTGKFFVCVYVFNSLTFPPLHSRAQAQEQGSGRRGLQALRPRCL